MVARAGSTRFSTQRTDRHLDRRIDPPRGRELIARVRDPARTGGQRRTVGEFTLGRRPGSGRHARIRVRALPERRRHGRANESRSGSRSASMPSKRMGVASRSKEVPSRMVPERLRYAAARSDVERRADQPRCTAGSARDMPASLHHANRRSELDMPRSRRARSGSTMESAAFLFREHSPFVPAGCREPRLSPGSAADRRCVSRPACPSRHRARRDAPATTRRPRTARRCRPVRRP